MQQNLPAQALAAGSTGIVKFLRVDQLMPTLKLFVPDLMRTLVLPGCGHWTQQERASEVNAALIAFLREVG